MSPDDGPQDDRFHAWWTEHRGIFLKIARAYAMEPSDQADLLQEMKLEVWRSAGSFRGQALPSTWIYRVCLNTALTWRRDELQHRNRIQVREPLPELPSTDARPGNRHEESELLEQLYAAIRRLDPGPRSLVLLALEGLSYGAIGEITGMTENHVGVALTRARAQLAGQLKGVRHELE